MLILNMKKILKTIFLMKTIIRDIRNLKFAPIAKHEGHNINDCRRKKYTDEKNQKNSENTFSIEKNYKGYQRHIICSYCHTRDIILMTASEKNTPMIKI
ncbi:hypothetical protein COBT_001821 [Conglomerata obtusa]